MTLPNVLRIVALLVVVMVVGEYVVLGELLIAPFVLAAVLFALSFAGKAWPAATAYVAILLCVAAPAAAIVGYLRGDLVLLIPIFDVIVFGWLLWTAVRTLRNKPAT